MADDNNLPINDLPCGDSITAEIRMEKSARSLHSLSMHRWWGVRPPIVARLAAYLTLVDDHTVDANALASLAMRSPTPQALSEARSRVRGAALRRVQRSHPHEPPTEPPTDAVLDPFAGTGAIVAEAGRLGCEVYAGDLSPVSHSILACALKFPQSLARASGSSADGGRRKWAGLSAELTDAAERVERRVLDRVTHYFTGSNRSPAHYWWSRTTTCECCKVSAPAIDRIPLLHGDGDSTILAASVANGQLSWTFAKAGRNKRGAGGWRCACCGKASSASAVQLNHPSQSTLIGIENDRRMKASVIPVGAATPEPGWIPDDSVTKALADLKGIVPLLSEPVRVAGQLGGRSGSPTYADLFTPRQALVAHAYVVEVKRELENLEKQGATPHQLEALRHYLAFLVSDVADRNSTLCDVQNRMRGHVTSFGLSAYRLPPAFVESFPAGFATDWLRRIVPAIERAAELPQAKEVYCGSADALPYEANRFDAVITDPPYYDRIPYDDLSRFFHVWESAIIGPPDSGTAPTSIGGQSIQRPSTTADAHRDSMLNAFREIHRVLRPGGSLCLLYTGNSVEGFKEYLDLCQKAGLEFLSIQKMPAVGKSSRTEGLSFTLLVFLRKPLQTPARAPLIAVDAAQLIGAAEAGKPVLYAALAKLLDEELDDISKKDLLPEGAKGSQREQLMEAVGSEDPRELLHKSFGLGGIRRIAKKLGAPEQPLKDRPLEWILEHFGFGVPPSTGGRQGPHAVANELRQSAAVIKQAEERSEITGAFQDACSKFESVLRLGVWSWAEFVFAPERDAILIELLQEAASARSISLDRLSFGHIAALFKKLPDRIAQAPAIDKIEQKLGRRHIWTTGGPKKLGERVDKLVTWRNKVEHNKEEYRLGTPVGTLKRDLAKVVEEARLLVTELAEANAIPQLATPFEEIRDQWNRRRYRLNMDDGTARQIRSSDPLQLGRQYIYLGTETNPVPVDPLILDSDRIAGTV